MPQTFFDRRRNVNTAFHPQTDDVTEYKMGSFQSFDGRRIKLI